MKPKRKVDPEIVTLRLIAIAGAALILAAFGAALLIVQVQRGW